MQLEPAVTTVDGDPLKQMIKGRALYLGKRVVGAFERQPVADVVINISQTAKRMRRYGQLQSAPVGQMHQLVPRLDQRGEQRATFALERAEIAVFRKAPRFVQAPEDLAESRLRPEPGWVQPPQPDKGGIEVLEPFVRSKDRDRGGKAFEHRGMGPDVPPQLAPRAFEIGAVERKADCLTARTRRLVHFEQPALAADHHMSFCRG